jgi:hypothetical protein
MLTILTLHSLPHGGYTGKIIVDGCLYAGTFAGEITIGNTIINFNNTKPCEK